MFQGSYGTVAASYGKNLRFPDRFLLLFAPALITWLRLLRQIVLRNISLVACEACITAEMYSSLFRWLCRSAFESRVRSLRLESCYYYV